MDGWADGGWVEGPADDRIGRWIGRRIGGWVSGWIEVALV